MKAWLLLAGAIVSEVSATMSLRAALDNRLFWIVAIIGYPTAYTCLAFVLREKMPVGVAYGIWAAVGVATTALLGALLFADQLTWPVALGIAVIIAGVLLVELGSRVARRQDAQ